MRKQSEQNFKRDRILQRRKQIKDDAPRKDLIPVIIKNKSFDDFKQFYDTRVKWYGYPLIHDMCFTVGLYQDLLDMFPKDDADSINTFINYSIKICSKATDEDFLCAIFLLENFTIKGMKICHPTQEQINQIIAIYPRVQRLKTEPNMSCFWSEILNYCEHDNGFDGKKYRIADCIL